MCLDWQVHVLDLGSRGPWELNPWRVRRAPEILCKIFCSRLLKNYFWQRASVFLRDVSRLVQNLHFKWRKLRPREGRGFPKWLSRARPIPRAPDSKSCTFSPVLMAYLPNAAGTGHEHKSRTPLHWEGVGARSPGSLGPVGWSLSHLTYEHSHSSACWSRPKSGHPSLV